MDFELFASRQPFKGILPGYVDVSLCCRKDNYAHGLPGCWLKSGLILMDLPES